MLITGTFCAVFSFLILCFICDDKDELLRDTLLAVFTGCMFAAPSSILYAVTQSREIYEKEAALAAHIAATLEQLPENLAADNTESSHSDFFLGMRPRIQQLDILAIRLGNLAEESHLVAGDSVVKLLDGLYDIRSLYEDFYKTSHADTNSWSAFCQTKNSCLSHCEKIRVAPFFHRNLKD